MYCEQCGMLIGDSGEPCPVCGQIQTSVIRESTPTEPSSGSENMEGERVEMHPEAKSPVEAPAEPADLRAGRTMLLLGIVGLILAGSVYLSIVGVAVSAVTLYRSAALTGTAAGKTANAKCGTVLGWLGLILGALLTLCAVVFLVIASRYAVR